MDITEVRPARPGDYAAVAALWRQQNAFHVSLEPSLMRMLDVCLTRDEFEAHRRSRDREVAVAAAGADLVGFALLVERQVEGGWAVPRSVAFVQEICVAESLRGQGVGRMLMDYVQRWARRRGLGFIELNVWASNDRAVAFYRSLGFEALRYEFSRPVADP